jgi:hypothetical protein
VCGSCVLVPTCHVPFTLSEVPLSFVIRERSSLAQCRRIFLQTYGRSYDSLSPNELAPIHGTSPEVLPRPATLIRGPSEESGLLASPKIRSDLIALAAQVQASRVAGVGAPGTCLLLSLPTLLCVRRCCHDLLLLRAVAL